MNVIRQRRLAACVTVLVVATSLLGMVPRRALAKGDGDELAEEPAPTVGQGEARRTLAERIPSVTHRAFVKHGRIELFPLVGLSLNDPFYRYVQPGAGLNYYLTETLSLGLSADFYAAISTPIDVAGGSAAPVSVFNKPVFGARAQVSWLPLYGKISWLAESVMHFDTYVAGSVGVIGAQSGGTALAGGLALGQHYFLNEWAALRLEIRTEMFEMARTPSVVTTKSLQSLLSASLALCFYLPREAEPEDL